MPPRAADQENAIPAAPPVAGGSRLEQLPAELTQSIFYSLHIFDKPHQADLIRPLSKHLYPYSTIALYRRIKITTFDDLSQLCASTYDKATLGPLIQELEFYGHGLRNIPTDVTFLALLLRLVEVLLCTSLNLKTLTVRGWDLVGRVVLSERFGREAGRALEKIAMINCFKSIEGSIITAWSHLRHLSRLSHLEYTSRSVTVIEGDENPPNLGGFEQLKSLTCALDDLSSPHAIQLASLFPLSKLASVRLVSLNLTTRPNFAMLDSLPATIETLQLDVLISANLTGPIQPPLSLNRFHHLRTLYFLDNRIFDEGLVDQIITLASHSLVSLQFFRKCQITFQLLHRFLSGLDKNSNFKKLLLPPLMLVGTIGLSYKNGALPVLENNILVPGAGWKRPAWRWMTLLQAQELEIMCIEKGVELTGAMKIALEVEEAFKKEESIIQKAMYLLRDGGEGWVKLD